MGRVFGILLIVLGIWVGLEYYTKGSQAFGGAFASWFEPIEQTEFSDRRYTDERMNSPAKRMGNKVERSYKEGEDRYRRQLGE